MRWHSRVLELVVDMFWYCCLTYALALDMTQNGHMKEAEDALADLISRKDLSWRDVLRSMGPDVEDGVRYVEAMPNVAALLSFQVRDAGSTMTEATRDRFKARVSLFFQQLITSRHFYHNTKREALLVDFISDTVERLFALSCSQSGISPHCSGYIDWLLSGFPRAASRVSTHPSIPTHLFGAEQAPSSAITKEEELFDGWIRSVPSKPAQPRTSEVRQAARSPRLEVGVRNNPIKYHLPLTTTSPAFQAAKNLHLQAGRWSPRAVSLSQLPPAVRSPIPILEKVLSRTQIPMRPPSAKTTPQPLSTKGAASAYRQFQEGQRRKQNAAESTVANLNAEMAHLLHSLDTKYAFAEDPTEAITMIERLKSLFDAAQESRDIALNLPQSSRCELRERGAFLARLLAARHRDVHL